MENLGILYALGAALAWGSYMVPFKMSRSSNLIQFQALMGVGIFISGLIFSLMLGYSLNLNLYGLFSGSLWAIANAIALSAIFNIGISRAVPLIASLVILSTSESFFPMSLGIFLTALIIALIAKVKLKKEALKESLLSGTIWNTGNLLSLVAIPLSGLSKVIPVSPVFNTNSSALGAVYF